MKISMREIPVKDVVSGYIDDETHGVLGLSGRLNIRPPYQREFVYKDKQRDAVIESVLSNFPLNVMYWSLCPDGTYECMDGQQRTISLCQYAAGNFSLNHRYIHNLKATDPAAYDQFMNYKLMVYICEGTETEKLDWFRIINIAGEKLTEQEMRNAIYHGPWLADAKKYFSKNACPAYQIAQDYMAGTPIRQDYLEAALKWISDADGIDIEEYMAQHQNDSSANALWMYFQQVINWVQLLFPNRDKTRLKLMKGLPWGLWYNEFSRQQYDSNALEKRIKELLLDDDVTNQRGIYHYVLDGDEKWLNIRAFSEKDKRRKYDEQQGICPKCGKHFEYEQMDGDHILPWAKGGKTEYSNLQMRCIPCNRGDKK